ncbi:MAG: RNA polymerase sigma factor [Lachnospiraceae bacterium]|nr:RNA polymerase sigma factor [Candidatus Merdinaster equi]
MAKEYDHEYIAKLVRLTQQNNSDAFAQLYAMTYNKIYNYAHHYMHDAFLAQDAVQEIYIHALKNIDKIKDPSLFVAWLNQIAFRVCYDMTFRQGGVQAQATDDTLLELVSDERDSSSPEKCAIKQDEHERLRQAINELHPDEKQCIIMKYYRNMKLEDIADALDISRSTVKRYIASAEAELRFKMRN